MQGAKVTRTSAESDDSSISQSGRTLEEARKLVEQSFGNYVGSNVMLAAKEELARIQTEIQLLALEITEEAIDKKSRKLLSHTSYKEIADLQEELRVPNCSSLIKESCCYGSNVEHMSFRLL